MNKGILLVIITAVISGVSIFLNAYGVQGLNPYAFTGMKNIVVALLLFSMVGLWSKKSELESLSKKQWFQLASIGLIGGSIPFLLFFKGLSIASGATGAFIHKTMIVWVTLGALLFLKEKINWKISIAAGALLLGNFLVLKQFQLVLSAGSFFIAIATLLWSVEIILSKKILTHIPASLVAFGRMGFGALFILAFLLISENLVPVFTWSASAWLWVLVTSVFLLGYVWTFYHGLRLIKASTAVALLSLGSVITSLLQFSIVGYTPSVLEIVGHGLIVSAVALFILVKKNTYFAGSTA